VPPCPACGDRDLRIELGRVVQLSIFGPPVARNVAHFLCAGCGQKRDDYDPDDWPDDE
jgi:hypothetical protein